MGSSEIDNLIRFHTSALKDNRLFMSESAVYLEEQTIKALQELKVKIVKEEVIESRNH